MKSRYCLAVAAAACSLSACSDAETSQAPAPARSSDPAPAIESFEIDAPAVGVWTPLVQLEWELEPGREGYWCKRVRATRGFWIRGFRPVAPSGTHHVGLSKDPGENGVTECSGAMLQHDFLWAAGVGAEDEVLPEQVGVKVDAGDQLFINVHVFNTSADRKTATSGVAVLTADDFEDLRDAGFVFAGADLSLMVPPGRTVQKGTCKVLTDTSLLGMAPHMHRLGVHQRVQLLHGVDATTLFDRPYAFGEQTLDWMPTPVALSAGDAVQVECTYENPGTSTVYFGPSTMDEMCFSGLFTTPPINAVSTCVN